MLWVWWYFLSVLGVKSHVGVVCFLGVRGEESCGYSVLYKSVRSCQCGVLV